MVLLLKFVVCMYMHCMSLQTAELALFMLKQIPLPECVVSSGAGVKFGWQLLFKEAELYWSRGEASLALHLMRRLISDLVYMYICQLYHLLLLIIAQVQLGSMEATQYLSSALCCYGSWLSDTRRESPMIIFNDYLQKVCLYISNYTALVRAVNYRL